MRDPYRPLRAQTLVVHLSSGESIRGVVVNDSRRLLQLVNAELIGSKDSAALDGDQFIHHDRIKWVQRLYPSGGAS